MRALPLALLVLLLALPLGAAQVPPQLQPCGPLTIPADPAPPAAEVGAGESVQVTVDVQMGGQVDGTVTVTATTTSAGWSITESPPPTTVAAGSSASFVFTILAGEDATGDALVQFSASGTCDSPLGASCPGGACVAGSANAQVGIPFREEQGFSIPGLDNLAFPVEYLIAAIVLVGLATAIPFVMRKKRGGIAAECPEPLKIVKPGRGTSFPIELRNATREPVSATFEVGPVPEGWSAFMPLPEVQLAARESRSLWLMVRSPAVAQQGDAVDVELRLKDATGAAATSVRVRAEVQGSAEA